MVLAGHSETRRGPMLLAANEVPPILDRRASLRPGQATNAKVCGQNCQARYYPGLSLRHAAGSVSPLSPVRRRQHRDVSIALSPATAAPARSAEASIPLHDPAIRNDDKKGT